MATQAFIDSLMEEIIQPGVDRLMESCYFTELQNGTLSMCRLQGWAIQHYLHNVALLKGFALCMVKSCVSFDGLLVGARNLLRDHPILSEELKQSFRGILIDQFQDTAREPELFNYFLYQLNEEQYHPHLAKKFGFAIGLREEDFQNATPIFECLAHTSKTIHAMLLGSAAENRASGLVNETMICRYSKEFDTYLRKHYGLDDKALQFFVMHSVADQEHLKMAAEFIAHHASTDRQEELVRESARHMVRFKLAKFDGIYDAYA